jgi:LCP family protein required for cell wall assembly
VSEELTLAFEQMTQRGTRAGGAVVVTRALALTRPDGPRPIRRHALVAFGAIAASLAVVVAGVAIVRVRTPSIERVDVGAALADGDGAPGVMTLLVVGSDSRAGLDDPMRRADAVMLLRVERESGAVSVLSMPRDLYVPIAGTGASDRLAVASLGGATRLIETVRAVTGVAIDHFVEFDFAGFEKVVDAVGGVDLQVPEAMRDRLSGLELSAGCNHLDGAAALAYARARHVEVQDRSDGGFRADPTGDLGRIGRQQLLLVVALDQLTRTRAVNRIDRVADAIADNVRVDSSFSIRDAVAFVKSWVNGEGPLQLLTYPSTAALENGAAVLRPDAAQAASVVEGFSHPPSDAPRQTPGASC